MRIKIPETEIKIRIKLVDDPKRTGLKAYANLDFGLFAVHGFTLRDSKFGGLWLVMPSNKRGNRNFQFFYASDADFKKNLEKAVIEAYKDESIPVIDTPLRNEDNFEKDLPF